MGGASGDPPPPSRPRRARVGGLGLEHHEVGRRARDGGDNRVLRGVAPLAGRQLLAQPRRELRRGAIGLGQQRLQPLVARAQPELCRLHTAHRRAAAAALSVEAAETDEGGAGGRGEQTVAQPDLGQGAAL